MIYRKVSFLMLTLCLVMMIISQSYGQKFQYDLHTGINLSRQSIDTDGVFLVDNTTVTPNVKTGHWAFQPGLNLTARFGYRLFDWASIYTGIGYLQKGFRSKYSVSGYKLKPGIDMPGQGIPPLDSLDYYEFAMDDVNRLHYLHFDFGLRLRPGKNFYVFGGYRIERLLGINLEDQLAFQEIYYDQMDRTIFIGMGYELNIWDNFTNYLELEVNPGLTDIYRDPNEAFNNQSEVSNFSLGLNLGIRIR